MLRGYYGGHQIIGHGSRFSLDGKVIFTAGPMTLFVYSSITSKKIAQFSKYEIRNFQLVPNAATKVCMLTTHGMVLVWDYQTQKIDQSCQLSLHYTAVIDMVVSQSDASIFFSVLTPDVKNEGKILKFGLEDLRENGGFSVQQPCARTLTISPSGKYLCILPLQRPRQGVLLKTTEFSSPTKLAFPHQVKVAAFDPNDRYFAVGCESGKILLYTDLDTFVGILEFHSNLPSTLHWHASMLSGLKFSSDSHYLFSIGEEGVLVSWRLKDMHKSFVPRIGLNALDLDIHPIKQSYILVSMQDNSFKIIDQANHKAKLAVYGIAPDPGCLPFRRKESCLQPKTGYLVIRSGTTSLQFYDLARDKHVSKLQVVPSMEVSKTKYRTEQLHQSFEPYLQHFAFNKTGTVLMTVIIRSRLLESEIKTDLRFFNTDSTDRPFELNSEILDPHKGDITAVSYSPVEDVAVTTSKKGSFRIWSPRSEECRSSWRCKTIGSYKSLPLSECSFSSDGSVLAIAYPSGVALWDPTTLLSLGQVSLPEMSGPCEIHDLRFISQSDYLVASDPISSLLVVWNLQSLEIHWATLLSVNHLTMDLSSQKFAVSLRNEPVENGLCEASKSSVVVFDPRSSTPCAVYTDFHPSIGCLHFALPGTKLFAAGRQMENGVKHSHAPLVVMQSTRQYSIETETGLNLGPLNRSIEEETDLSELVEMPSTIERAFGALARREEDEMEVEGLHEDSVHLDIRDFSKLPSHALPSVSVLCSNLLDQIVEKSGRT